MANIRKSFNFKSGLQVDNNNFVVNTNGLVGIGTSIPTTYLLNVYGDIRSTGIVTSSELFTGVGTITNLSATNADIGIITASQLQLGSNELVDELIGYARTTFITDNAGIGLHTTSKLGINTTISPGTTDPEFSVFGDVNITGIVTAESFDGSLNATDLTSGTIDNERFPSNINVTGIITASSFEGNLTGDATGLSGTPNITVGIITAESIVATGIITGSSIDVNTGSITGGSINVTGIITGSSIDVNTGSITGGSIDVNTGSITGGSIDVSGIVTVSTLNSTKISSSNINASSYIGIGTDDSNYEQHIRKNGNAVLKITSDENEAIIAIGRSTSVSDANNNNTLIKVGTVGGLYPYSSFDSLNIINQGDGNFNSYIDNNGTDNYFMWLRGTNVPLLTLTHDGNLGIGITNPTHKLNVQGISTFTGNAHFDTNVTIGSLLTVNSITISQSLNADVTGNLTGNVTGNLTGDVNGDVLGISTFNDIQSGRVGIGTTLPRCALDILDSTSTSKGFVLLPFQDTSNRNEIGAGSTIEGSLIYNRNNNRFEYFNGTDWVGLSTEA